MQNKFISSIPALLLMIGCQAPDAIQQSSYFETQPVKVTSENLTQRHSVYFDTNSDQIGTSEQASLNAFINSLSKSAVVKIRLDGHADMRASDSYNLDLSLRRAKALSRIFTERGLSHIETEIQGLGERAPASIGTDAKSLALNRRVEVIATTLALNIEGCDGNDMVASMNGFNHPSSQLGCSNLQNLVSMVADPRDLAGPGHSVPQPLSPPNSLGQFNAIERYQTNEIPDLPENGGN